MVFVDYVKACDSIKISEVTQVLRRQGKGEVYIKFLEEMYTGSTATVKLHKKREPSN